MKAIATLAMIIAAFLINALSNIAPINGQSVGEISNTVFKDVLMTPANYAFAIWGVIYLCVFAFGFYQWGPAQRHQKVWDPIRIMMIVASAAQIAWIGVFLTGQYVLSLVAMIVIWLALARGYLYLLGLKPLKVKEHRYIQIPWSIYWGWISVATIVNVALTLFALGWQGGWLAPQTWTISLMVVTMAIGLVMVIRHRDLAFGGVLIWALVAIAQKHQAVSSLFFTGLGTAIVLGLATLYVWLKSRPKDQAAH